MTPDEIRAANERALNNERNIIRTREGNLEMAERHFPGSAMAVLAGELVEVARKDYAELEARIARIFTWLNPPHGE